MRTKYCWFWRYRADNVEPSPDEGEKNRGCGYEYKTCKWHHEQHPSYILPLDLKIHPNIAKRIHKVMQYKHCPETTSESVLQKKIWFMLT